MADPKNPEEVRQEFHRGLSEMAARLTELLDLDERVEDETGSSVLATPEHKLLTEALADLLRVKDLFAAD